MTRQALLIVGFLVAAYPLHSSVAQQQKVGAPPEVSNMRLVGSNDLQARSAYQPTIHDRATAGSPISAITAAGRHSDTGQSADRQAGAQRHVDPRRHRSRQPDLSQHIPGQPGTYESGGAQMVRICDGASLPKGDRSAVYMLRTFGGEAHEIWNVADPAEPVLVTRLRGLRDTHKSWWECDTGIAFPVLRRARTGAPSA